MTILRFGHYFQTATAQSSCPQAAMGNSSLILMPVTVFG
jgi:hypothetical protein